MDGIFGDKVSKSELAALRALLMAHAAVGVDLSLDAKAFATVTLVWPTTPNNDVSSPWVMNESVVGRQQLQSLVRTLFLEGRATKVLHSVRTAAHWMATQGLANVVTAASNVVDLQLYYEHSVDANSRSATLPQMLEATTKGTTMTTEALYRTLLNDQLANAPITTKRGAMLTQLLLAHSVQRAHLSLVCFERLMLTINPESKKAAKRTLQTLTQRRLVTASRLPPHRKLIWFAKESQLMIRSLEVIGDDALVASTIPRVKRHCDIETLLALLSPSLYESIVAIDQFADRLVAITLDIGSKPKAYLLRDPKILDGDTECVELRKSSSKSTPTKLFGAFRKRPADSELTSDDILDILALAGGEAAIDKSNRVSIDRQLHRIAAVRSKDDRIVGLTMRAGRIVQFASNILLDLLHHPDLQTKSVLVLGGSVAGKTSLLRDIARCLSEGHERVCIVDTTNEIGGDGAIPHRSIDRATRFTVQSLETNADTIVECVQNHIVDTLVVDEVTNDRDVRALAFAKNHCRRRVIAGCAIRDLQMLVQDIELNRLIGGVQSTPNAGKLRDIPSQHRERIGPPVVDVIVELNAARLGECRIVWNIPGAVDDAMAGRAHAFETRIQAPDELGIQIATK